MKIIYTAGPIRVNGKYLPDGMYRNMNTARNIARKLWGKSWAVICPHMNTMWMEGDDLPVGDYVKIPSGIFVDGDLEIISRCDAILMLPGWEASEGAKIEHEHAKKLGKKIYYDLTQVPNERKTEEPALPDTGDRAGSN